MLCSSLSATSVASLTCSDGDGDTLMYSLTGGDDALPKFSIPSPNLGHLETSLIALDFETKSSYKLEVSVSDGEHEIKVDVYVTVSK